MRNSRSNGVHKSSTALKLSASLIALISAANAAAQTVIDTDPAVLDNAVVIDPGLGTEAPGVVLIGEPDGTELNINNSGVIQGRGNASAGLETAGDGIRFERERLDGSLANPSTALFTGTITNTGTIASEGANGTVAGVRFVNGVSFQGTFTNEATGVISGTQNGLYFGNPTPSGGGDHTGGVVNNLGVISSDSRAFNLDGLGLTVNNSGSILGTGNQRNGTFYADGTADDFTVSNLETGVIDAGMGNEGSGLGLEIGGAVDGANTFTIVNNGTIQGRGNGPAGENSAGDGIRVGNVGNIGVAEGTFTNTGLIASEGANGTVAGVRFVNGISFAGTFDNSGTITGVQNGVYFGNPVDGEGADHSNGVFNNLEGGVISSGSRAFNIDGLGLTVNNAGSILGLGDQRNGTVYSDGTATDFTVNNSGLIDAGEGLDGSGFAAEIQTAGNTFTFVNSGDIVGRGQGAFSDGFRVGNGGNIGVATVDITNNGTISSESMGSGAVSGLRFVNGVSFAGVINNSGTISGVQNGVYFGNPVEDEMGNLVGADHSDGVFNNLEGGVISSDSRAFNLDGLGLTVNNAGQIIGTASQRNGTFYADGGADDFTINNEATGVIDAGMGNEGSGLGLEIGGTVDGANTFVIVNAGTIQGRGNASAATNAAGDGIRVGNVGNVGIAEATIVNTGTIASEGANGTVAGVRFVNGISFAGTFDNSGTITGVQNGVYFGNPVDGEGADHSDGVFNNLAGGLISSDSRAFNIDGLGLTVNNAGDILGTGDQRNGTVYADGGADDFTFNNLVGGVIDAGEGNQGSGFGVEIGSAVDGANTFTLVNDGTIQGRGNAPAGDNLAGDGIRIGNVGNVGIAEATIVNTGTIASEGANGTVAGVRFVNGISFAGTFDNSGTITGVQNGVYFGNPVDGEGADHSNGVFNNLAGGLISSDSRAFNIDGLGLTVNNAGDILGTGDQRNGTVYADATSDAYTFNNFAGAVVDAGIGNNGSGVSLQSGNVDGETVTFALNNAGTIQGRGTELVPAGLRIFNGAENVSVDGTIINSGGIFSENDAAILIENVNFIGSITNSGVVSGASAFDASTALGAIAFTQIDGALIGDFIGSDFTDTLTFADGASALNGSVLGDVDVFVNAGAFAQILGDQILEGNLVSDGTLAFTLGEDSLDIFGDATFNAGSIVNIATPDDITTLALGGPISVLSETGTFTNNGLNVVIDDDDFLVDFVTTLGSVTVTPTATDLSIVSADANVSAFGGALTSAFANGALDADIANALNASPDVAGFEAAALTLLPAINEGVTREVFESHELADQFISRRLGSSTQRGVWAQGFGRTAERDAETASVTGYDADAFGASIGADTKISDLITVGVAFNYANISIENDGATEEETDIDSFQVSAYAGYNSGPVFINGSIGYLFGDGESERSGLIDTVSGEFDLDGFTAQVTGGYTFTNNALKITPIVGLRFASLSQDTFTEAGDLNLTIDADSTEYLDGRIGVDVEGDFGNGFIPFVRGAYVYDFIGDERVLNASFDSASAPFALTTTEPTQSRFDLNAGFSWDTGSGVTISVEYDGEFASGYSSNGGFIRARFAF